MQEEKSQVVAFQENTPMKKFGVHVILDLDETCIHSTEETEGTVPSFGLESFEIKDEDGKTEFTSYKRPYLNECLNWVKENCNVSVWSAGEKNYVIDIIKNIFEDPSILKFVLWREHCMDCEKDTGALKNLNWLREKMPTIDRLGHAILIDDLKENCEANPGHAINISKFIVKDEHSSKDKELTKIRDQLERINSVSLTASV